MKRNIIRNFFGVVLVLIIITSIFLVYKNIDEKEIQLDNVSLNEIDEYSGIALMLEQTNGEYTKSDSSDWPRKGYKLNQRLSGCVDESGNTIEKALTYEYGTLKVKTRVNASCYLYFDKRKAATEELIATVPEEQLWDSTLEDDGYRYVGTNPDNYICFGTDSISECTSDTDKYMYRIIGIFEDEEGKQHLKLIKKEALNTSYAWHSDASTDTDWEDSDLYKGINGSYFATNSEYSYMQDSVWTDKISEWNYTATNTLTAEKNGPDYGYLHSKAIYLHELNKSGKLNESCYTRDKSISNCNIGEWKTVTTKIGLIYASDYGLSLGKQALSYTSFDNYDLLMKGWIYLFNNDTSYLSNTLIEPPSIWEWTMSRYGMYTYNFVWRLGVDIGIGDRAADGLRSVRPVFYLEADTELKEGLGTIKEPYIINNDTAVEEIIGTAGSDLWESTLEDDGYRYVGTNPDNYICFGTTNQEECMNDTDKYMYRIIGIFEDEEGQQHLKLIKKEALNTAYAWHSNYSTDTDWDESDLYKGINGSYFLTNKEYSYMQDSAWTNKIAEWNYTATNTKTYENSGMDYYSLMVRQTYLHEMNRSAKTSSVGVWDIVSSKIGLMYVSDYQLSLGSIVLDYTNNTSAHLQLMKTGWLHISNNDIEDSSSYEWTMSRYGDYYGYYHAWLVHSAGNVDDYTVDGTYSIRPVFYLTSDTQLSKGTGTSTDPYTIKPAKVEIDTFTTEELIENVSSDVLWKSTLEDDGYRYVGTDPNNYVCFGYENAEEDCDFTNATNTDLYAYRIIGIFEDSEGTPHIKLIKKEALAKYVWNADYQNDVAWNASDLYKGINGSYFLTNTTYGYMQDSTWTNKIETWDYTATNTKTYESSGMDYYSSVVRQTYLHEMNRSTKTSTVGVWDTVPAKIGLMYVSDYQLSLGSTALDYTNSTSAHYQSMKTGWMHISNNDSGAPSAQEWTISRYGAVSNGYYRVWNVNSDGYVYWAFVDHAYSVRPVFYLTTDVIITGEGTTGSPYIIS